MDTIGKFFSAKICDTLKVLVPNSTVIAVINLADFKTIAELGLIGLSAAYTIWRWRRDLKKGGGA